MAKQKTISYKELEKMLGTFTYTENFPSLRSDKKVANQFILHYNNGIVFQSYKSIIAVKVNGNLYLTPAHDYSNTTSKYCTQFTGYPTQERRQMIEEGEINLIA